MWLLTAIGSVHGQNSFTFALEQRKTYTVGRDRDCDIRFEGRTVRPQHGTVIVGDWDPTNPGKAPDVRWRSEPKKTGTFPAFNTVTPRGIELYGNLDKGDYELDGIDEGTMGCYLHDTDGMGIELAENAWFLTKWVPLAICHEKMKDEDEAFSNVLLQYCIYHSPVFEEERIPDVVISSSYRAITTNNYAVCYGIRIVKPNYLSDLIKHLDICWKKVADSQDSLRIPDSADEVYRPSLDDALPLTRKSEAMWLPEPRRKRLFIGWRILGLRTKNVPSEKRYLLAMGVEYDDVDITTNLPKSAKDFESRIVPWVKTQVKEGGLEKCLVVHFARVKEEFKKAKVDFNSIVGSVCSQLEIIVVSGNVCWGAVADNGVQAYIDHLSANLPITTAAPVEATVPIVTAPAATRRSTRHTSVDSPPPTTQAGMPQSSAVTTGQTPFIPSTFPEESDQPIKAPPSAQLPRQTTPEVSQSTGMTSKRPLKKRTAKKIDLFADDLGVIPESSAFVMDIEPSQRAVSQRTEETKIRDSQESLSQEAETNSMAPRSRLKRRAGPQTQSQFNFGFDESFDIDKKKEETAAEIQEVYEQSKAASRAPPSKRQRLSEEPERAGSVSRSTTSMELDEPEEGVEDVEDPMQSMLRKAREAREAQAQATLARKAQLATQKSMPPPLVPKQRSRNRSPSEEVEEVEVKKSKSTKTKSTQNDPDVDTEFQKAIKKSKKDKKDLDELDKDFNALKIPKSEMKPVQAVSTTVYDYPDYSIVNQFEDDMRGNFIQIVRKDLFRKDLGGQVGERVDDGRPNFKKFKKNIVRREPMKLALAAPNIHDAEMGEPYWATESTRPGQTQTMSQRDNGEEEMPLLPPSKRRLMAKDDSGFDESIPASKSRRGAAPSASLSTQRPSRATRASSVQSDASSAPSTSTRSKSTVTTRKKPAAKGKQTAAPVVVEDSENEVAEDLDKTPSAYTTGLTGRSRVTGTRGMSGIGVTSTLEGDRTRGTRTTQATPSGNATQGRGANGRRKLLVDDDDDDDVMVFKGPQKKRRLL